MLHIRRFPDGACSLTQSVGPDITLAQVAARLPGAAAAECGRAKGSALSGSDRRWPVGGIQESQVDLLRRVVVTACWVHGTTTRANGCAAAGQGAALACGSRPIQSGGRISGVGSADGLAGCDAGGGGSTAPRRVGGGGCPTQLRILLLRSAERAGVRLDRVLRAGAGGVATMFDPAVTQCRRRRPRSRPVGIRPSAPWLSQDRCDRPKLLCQSSRLGSAFRSHGRARRRSRSLALAPTPRPGA
jgi:hypothetical protein